MLKIKCCPSCTWHVEVELVNGVCPQCDTNWVELLRRPLLGGVDGSQVLPKHSHFYVDGYCACGHSVR